MAKMKLQKWEKDICKAMVNMYIAKEIEINVEKWLEHEVSQIINNMNCDHRNLIEEYLLTLISKEL